MGGGTPVVDTPEKIGGISGQGGGRKMPAVATSIGELIVTATGTRLAETASLSPGRPDIRPLKPLGAFSDTVWTGQGGGSAQAGTGDELAVYWHYNTGDGTEGAVTARAGGGGGWGAAGGSGTQTLADFSRITGGNVGAAGGKAINTNGHAVTWLAGSARAYGAIG